ncbi:hypothetical protein P8452_75829 [Trifolium repens]|nr:hypothetical protein P8452_75829 [Trifolium repens]
MGEGMWENIWTIKSLLRGFELVSGLKINFVKSNLIGLNVETRFLEASASFLSCMSEEVPFKFLGIPVGANPRRQATWKPVVDAMTKRLNSWSSRLLSYGGRITLINSVLSSLPLYFFSFFKAPSCVIKQLVKLQRNFLWGGGLGERRLCWVKWDQICLPKEQGGLGIKNLAIFNKSLLGKWKWRVLSDGDAVWSELLHFRYGHLSSNLLAGVTLSNAVKSSLWWRDIIGLDRGSTENTFMANLSCRAGDDKTIGFWKFKWIGDQPFCALYPDLFAKETFKDALVYERLQDTNQGRIWNWNWLQHLTFSESQHLEELQGLLADCYLNPDLADRWKWKPGLLGLFSVRSYYSILINSQPTEAIETTTLTALKKLWKIDVPSKVLAFGWRLLLDRLPTRLALNHRGILHNPNELSCVFCAQNVEDSGHLFFSCQFSIGIWTAVSNWIGKALPTGADCCSHFCLFGNLFRLKKGGGRVSRLIWLATTWSLWKHRNDVIFNGVTQDASNLVNNIKITSWIWFSGRFGRKANLTFLNWCIDPFGCFTST